MALPGIDRAAPVSLPVTPRQAPAQVQADADSAAAADTGASHARRPGMLATAMNMQDDLSALVATLQRRRDNAASGSSGSSTAWVDHVLDEQADDKLARFRQGLADVRGGAAVLQLLRGLFPDPSDALAVLRALMADDELEDVREALADALAQLLDEQQAQGLGAALRGGANVAMKARLASSEGMPGARALRQAYRDFLAARDALGQYAAWMALHGLQQRGRVLDFIEQAVTADMLALDPSGSLREFGQLLHKVRQLAMLRSVDHALVRECSRLRLAERGIASSDALVQGIIAVMRGLMPWPELFQTVLPAMRVLLDARERTVLAHALHRAVHGMPDAAWADDTARADVLAELETLVAASIGQERLRQRSRPEVRA